jgi:hypothetical protein
MTGSADFAYAQARIQARHGTRLTDREWRRLDAMHDVAQYLHALRATSRARWVERITPGMSSHAVEARLRAEWRSYAEEIARFQPESWRAAVAWTAFLADLPVLDHLLRGGVVHCWMAEDEIYAPWSRSDARERAQALARSPVASLLREANVGTPTLRAWLNVWRRLWPRTSGAQSGPLESVVRAVVDHGAFLRNRTAAASLGLRMALAQRLCVLFRRHFETAAASIAHLILEALDLERVRAGLVRRVLLEPQRVDDS